MPAPLSCSTQVAANSSAVPVCDAHTTVVIGSPATCPGSAADGTAEREKMPASTPSTHIRFPGDSGVTAGSNGTSSLGGFARIPAIRPDRNSRSSAVSVADDGSVSSTAASASTGDPRFLGCEFGWGGVGFDQQ